MRVGVFVVIATGQLAQLPVEALAAGVVFARRAVAIAAPVAEGLDGSGEHGIIGEYGAAFAGGDVVRRVETQRADVAEGADVAAIVSGAEGIAAILDQPQAMLVSQCAQRNGFEGIAQGVGQHDGAGARADGGGDACRAGIVGGQFRVDENGNHAVLQNRIDGGGEARGGGDDFIAGFQGALAQQGRCQRGKRQQVGRGSGIDGERTRYADACRDLLFELVVEAAGGEPAIKRGIDQGNVGLGIEYASSGRHSVLSRNEGCALLLLCGILAHLGEDLLALFFECHGVAV